MKKFVIALLLIPYLGIAQTLENLAAQDTLFGNFYNEMSDKDKEIFNNNILTNAEIIRSRTNVAIDSVIPQAIETQRQGLYIVPGTFFDSYRSEYVDDNVLSILAKDVLTETDARDLRFILNNKRYIQKSELEKGGGTLEPNEIGKQFIDGNYLFFVEDINKNEKDKPPLLRWNYRNINP